MTLLVIPQDSGVSGRNPFTGLSLESGKEAVS